MKKSENSNMQGATLVIASDTGEQSSFPTHLSPENSCVLSTSWQPLDTHLSLGQEVVALDLPTHIPPHYAISLQYFLAGFCKTRAISDIIMGSAHPLVPILLSLKGLWAWRIWIDGQQLPLPSVLAECPQQVYWSSHSAAFVEALMLQGVSVSHIGYPHAQKTLSQADTDRLYQLDQALRERSEHTPLEGEFGCYLWPQPETETELDSKGAHFCVIQIDFKQTEWKSLLHTFLRHFELSQEVTMVLIPPLSIAADISDLYEELLSWFESEQIESELTLEIIILDPEEFNEWPRFPSPPVLIAQTATEMELQACLQVLRAGGTVVSLAASLNKHLNQIQTGCSDLPETVAPILGEWLQQLEGALFYTSEPAAYYLWNQNLLNAAWQRLK